MHTIATLPKAKISEDYFIESKFSALAKICDYLELPLKLADKVLVVSLQEGRLHRQCTVGEFIKFEGKPYCILKLKPANFYIIVRRGDIDYKITAKDFRLELLKIKGVLK